MVMLPTLPQLDQTKSRSLVILTVNKVKIFPQTTHILVLLDCVVASLKNNKIIHRKIIPGTKKPFVIDDRTKSSWGQDQKITDCFSSLCVARNISITAPPNVNAACIN